MKRFLRILLITTLIVGLLVSAAAAKTKITVTAWPHIDEVLRKIVPLFNEKYPDIEVEVKSMGYADVHNNLINSLAAGSGAPDVSAVEIGYIAKFTASGGLVDLNQPPYNAGQFKDQFVPYKWAQATTTDGRLIAMPWDIGPASLYYRRDVFEAAGLPSEPEEVAQLLSTWDSFIETGKKITRDTDGDGRIDQWFIADAGEVAPIIYRSDNKAFFDENGKPIIDRPVMYKAFEVAKAIRDNGLDAEIGAWSNEWYEAIKSGKTAVLLSGCWMGGHLKTWLAPDTAGKWGIVNLPSGMYANLGGSFLAITEQSKHKKEAWEFIKFVLVNPEIQLAMFKDGDTFPALMTTWDDPIFHEADPFFGGQKTKEIWIEAAKRVPAIPVHKADIVAQEIVGSALTSVLNEGKDINAAIRDAQMQVRRRAR